jgi:hypothetical protein
VSVEPSQGQQQPGQPSPSNPGDHVAAQHEQKTLFHVVNFSQLGEPQQADVEQIGVQAYPIHQIRNKTIALF